MNIPEIMQELLDEFPFDCQDCGYINNHLTPVRKLTEKYLGWRLDGKCAQCGERIAVVSFINRPGHDNLSRLAAALGGEP